jgi:DNA repair photolyase
MAHEGKGYERPISPSVAKPEGVKGRGASSNAPNRFEGTWNVPDEEWNDAEEPGLATQFIDDDSKSIISDNDSPDLGFTSSFNPYRGCEHGCIYCYARPTHEYLGMSAGLDFESRILVKRAAPELLRSALSSPKWQPRVLMSSGVTDCYQPVERQLQLTRRCLQVLAEFRNPVGIVTKNRLVVRDIDVLQELAHHRAVTVTLSVTSLRPDLCRTMEPRTSVPAARLAAIRALSDAGISVGVNVAPVIPGLTDREIPDILQACHDAGAKYAGMALVRLPFAVAPLFEQWLTEHQPEAKNRVLNRIKEMRGGKLNDPRFGSRMTGEGVYARQLEDLFAVARRRAGFTDDWPELSTAAFKRVGPQQLSWLE